MRMRVTGVVERIEARRDQDTSLPRQARIRIRLLPTKTSGRVGPLQFVSHPSDVTKDEVECAIDTDRFVTITATYDDAIGIRIGDEIEMVAFQRGDVAGPDECSVCGHYQPR